MTHVNPKIITAILTITLAPTLLFPEVLLNVDFDNHALGPYTEAMARADFPGASWYHGMDEGWGEIVAGRDGGAGKALKMKYPSGAFSPNASALQIKAVLSKAVDTAWVSYWVKFEEGFDFVKGGKLPGLCGGECITGGNGANGYNGWSARMMWRREGVAEQYMYYVTNEGWGEDLLFDKSAPKKRFAPGRWHRVNTQIVMNTPGVANGAIRSWFDGELSMEREDVLIRKTDELKIDQFYISTFFGGSDATWAPSADMYITYDDFLVVSRGESSPYPQILYTLPEGNVLRGQSSDESLALDWYEFTMDASASLGGEFEWIAGEGQQGCPTAADLPLAKRADTRWMRSYYYVDCAHIVENIRAYPRGHTRLSVEKRVFLLEKLGLTCDSAWQAMPLASTITSGDRFRMYLTIVDTSAKIIVGPTITDEPKGEHSFFGAVKYERGKFSALDGTTFVEHARDTVAHGVGTYEITFVCNFAANPMTYSVSVNPYFWSQNYYYYPEWANLKYRGYAKEINAYGTWSSRDQAAAVGLKRLRYTTGIAATPKAVTPAKKSVSIRPKRGGLIFSAPSPLPKSAQLEIFNAKGALVKRISISGKRDLFIPVRSKGLYLYRVKSPSSMHYGTVMVR